MLLQSVLFLPLIVCSVVDANQELSARVEALEARAVKAEQEIEQLKANQNSNSFFSVQFTADTIIPHGDFLDFDDVIVNFGDDYIQSAGLYM